MSARYSWQRVEQLRPCACASRSLRGRKPRLPRCSNTFMLCIMELRGLEKASEHVARRHRSASAGARTTAGAAWWSAYSTARPPRRITLAKNCENRQAWAAAVAPRAMCSTRDEPPPRRADEVIYGNGLATPPRPNRLPPRGSGRRYFWRERACHRSPRSDDLLKPT